MPGTVPPGYLLTAILIGMAFLCGMATAGTLTCSIGDRLPLNGTAYATNTLYIFVTGRDWIPWSESRPDEESGGERGSFDIHSGRCYQ